MAGKRYLTQEQFWAIIAADPEVTSVSLARQLGVSETSVRQIRINQKSAPWSCRMVYGICEICGLSMIRRGFRATHQRYHPHCRPQALRDMAKVHHQARKARTSETQMAEIVNRLHEYDDEGQLQSRAVAVNHQKRWTPDEDARVLDHPGLSLLGVSLELGRSLRAVKRRKRYLIHGD